MSDSRLDYEDGWTTVPERYEAIGDVIEQIDAYVDGAAYETNSLEVVDDLNPEMGQIRITLTVDFEGDSEPLARQADLLGDSDD